MHPLRERLPAACPFEPGGLAVFAHLLHGVWFIPKRLTVHAWYRIYSNAILVRGVTRHRMGADDRPLLRTYREDTPERPIQKPRHGYVVRVGRREERQIRDPDLGGPRELNVAAIGLTLPAEDMMLIHAPLCNRRVDGGA